MLFSYKAVEKSGVPREGTVDAQNIESAIETVEARGYKVIAVTPINNVHGSILEVEFTWFERVTNNFKICCHYGTNAATAGKNKICYMNFIVKNR